MFCVTFKNQASKFGVLRQNTWVEFHRFSHVSANFHLSSHECILSFQFSVSKFHEIVVKHDKGRVRLSFLAHRNLSIAILQVDSDKSRWIALLFSQFEVVNATDFGDDLGTHFWHHFAHFLEKCNWFQRHLLIICVSILWGSVIWVLQLFLFIYLTSYRGNLRISKQF